MITLPKFCDVCYETNPQKLVRCPTCKYSSVCREAECQATVSKSNVHKIYCEEKKLAFLCHTDYTKEPIFSEMPKPLNYGDYLKKNRKDLDLFTLIEFVSGKKFDKNKKPENRKEFNSFVTICHFSYTATIIRALDEAQLLKPDRETLSLHIVGAQHENDVFTRDTCTLFYVFMPMLKSLRISIIGPKIPHPASFSSEIDCFGKTINIDYCKVYYEDFEGPKPDFIMSFNNHFSKEPWDGHTIVNIQGIPLEKEKIVTRWTPNTKWVRGVRKIWSYKVPIACTSYRFENIMNDVFFMHNVARHKNIDISRVYGDELGDNIFRDPRPFLNHDKKYIEQLLRYNQYIFVLNWMKVILVN